jgi:uncharacterized protein YgiM (DUF1202 family)
MNGYYQQQANSGSASTLASSWFRLHLKEITFKRCEMELVLREACFGQSDQKLVDQAKRDLETAEADLREERKAWRTREQAAWEREHESERARYQITLWEKVRELDPKVTEAKKRVKELMKQKQLLDESEESSNELDEFDEILLETAVVYHAYLKKICDETLEEIRRVIGQHKH